MAMCGIRVVYCFALFIALFCTISTVHSVVWGGGGGGVRARSQSQIMKIFIKILDKMGHVAISVDEMGLDKMGRHLYSRLRDSKSSFNYPCSFLRNITYSFPKSTDILGMSNSNHIVIATYTYSIMIPNVDISSFTNKVIYHFNTGTFCCHMQGSYLMK